MLDLIFHQMSKKGDSENDIWDYKPLGKKKKRREPPSVSATVLKKRCLSGKSSQKSKSAKFIDDKVATAKHDRSTSDDVTGGEGSSNSSRRMENPDFPFKSSLIDDTDQSHNASSEDFCPMCQMPFSILVVQTQRWHVAECLETSRDSCEGI